MKTRHAYSLTNALALRPGRLVVCLLIVLLLTGTFQPTRASTQKTRTIGKIEVEGVQHSSTEDVILSSGLRIGQAFDVMVLDAAATKLANSGLFKKVGYRTHTNGNTVTVIFQVEETKAGASPVLFDNFVWFSDDELMAAVRREVPSFSGTAPDAGEMISSVTAALQKLLKDRNIEGTVEYMPSQDAPGSTKQEHVFSVSGIKMSVCTMHFPGARNVSEEKLTKSSKDLAGSDYSRKFTSVFALKNLFPIYRELGQLRATFGQPLAKPAENSICNGGVDLTIPVDEGLIYSWEKAEWTDNQVFTPQELDAALGMKTGEVANGLKFDKGLAALRKAYGRKGYLDLRLATKTEFDDAAQRVAYKIAVREGPQYRMGNLAVKGFSESTEKLLRELWPLKAGDVFDEGILEEFSKKSFSQVSRRIADEYRSEGKPLPKLDRAVRPNRKTLTVDVVFEIKS